MTAEALEALRTERIVLEQVMASLTDAEWNMDSGCPGWRVRDVIAHISSAGREAIEPLPLPPGTVLPEVRERQHDVRVDLRRGWTIDELLAEYHHYTPIAAQRGAALITEPLASNVIELPGLGRYPMHSLLNAGVFDVYCHLRWDLVRPRGPVERDLPSPTHDVVHPVIEWMMWGLPQMQGPELDVTVTRPITIELTGAGASVWTVSRLEVSGRLTVEAVGGGDVTVRSSAHDFVAWGTKRTDWRDHCHLEGESELAVPFLDTLDII